MSATVERLPNIKEHPYNLKIYSLIIRMVLVNALIWD